MRSKVKHSKVRNTGLLFEFLLRQITADVLNKRDNSKAAHMIKKRFNERTELGKELALYNILINKKFNSDKKADYFINEVVSEKRKLNTLEPASVFAVSFSPVTAGSLPSIAICSNLNCCLRSSII